MDKADEELRETVKKLWPLHAKKIDLFVPPKEGTHIKSNCIQTLKIIFKIFFMYYCRAAWNTNKKKINSW